MIPSENRNGDGIAPETLHELLSRERRRTVLRYLERSGGRVDVETLTAHVAAGERDEGRVREDHDRHVSISLHHCHLPKLDAAGVVDYDAAERTVRYLPHPALDRLLDVEGATG